MTKKVEDKNIQQSEKEEKKRLSIVPSNGKKIRTRINLTNRSKEKETKLKPQPSLQKPRKGISEKQI
jgi:hypothetical protein